MRRTVIAKGVSAAFQALASYGVDGREVARSVGITPAQLEDPGSRIDTDRFDRFIATACQASGDSQFGLSLALQTPMISHHFYHLLAASDSVHDVVSRLLRFQQMYDQRCSCDFNEEGDFATLSFDVAEPATGVWCAGDGYVGGTLIVLRAILMDSDIRAESVLLRRPEPEDRTRYDDLFRCPVTFGAKENSLRISRDLLARKIPTADPAMASQAESVMVRYLAGISEGATAARTRFEIARALVDGLPSRRAIARKLGLSDRNVHRRLAEEGTSFRQILEEVRRDLAFDYLRDRGMPQIEIAFVLGFSDASAFSRAFRRWTGTTPTEFVESDAVSRTAT